MISSIRALHLRTFVKCGARSLCSGPKNPKPPILEGEVDDFRTKPLIEKFKEAWEYKKRDEEEIPRETDILVVGGGVVGSCIAYWLSKKVDGNIHVTVVEKDPTYRRCATTRSAGGIRQQFSLQENIQLSMYGAEFLSDYKENLGQDAPDVQFNPEGYLFLANTDESAAQMEENFALQNKLGAKVRLYSKEMLQQQFPFIKAEDVKLASYGLQNEGWFDPWSFLQGLKQWNLRNEVGYLHGEVVDFRFVRRVVDEYRDVETVNEAIVRLPDGKLKPLQFCKVIIAAGADSGDVGRLLKIGSGKNMLSVPIPVEPRKRSIYCFHAPDAPIIGFPFLVDPSGAYVRREGLGGHFICGKSPAPEEDTSEDIDIDHTDETPFNEVIWPLLAKRVPAFENIKLQHSWSGCYDYNYLDENAIIGLHPYYGNVGICTGFSGHGLQMAAGAGRAMAEGIFEGSFQTIDLTRLGFQRVLMGMALEERGIV